MSPARRRAAGQPPSRRLPSASTPFCRRLPESMRSLPGPGVASAAAAAAAAEATNENTDSCITQQVTADA